MKIRSLAAALTLITCICMSALGQKCQEKLPGGPLQGGGNRPDVPKIIEKPQPEYTEEARRHEITGTVLLRGTFHESGKVQDVCWATSLPYGLTENAIKAAYKIVFEPAKKNGQPVTTRIFIQYNFDLY